MKVTEEGKKEVEKIEEKEKTIKDTKQDMVVEM